MDKTLVDPNLSPDTNRPIQILPRQIPPVWIICLLPIMKAKHDGEGAGRQQLLVVVVVQAVGCRQGKSVAYLKCKFKYIDSLQA